jgi:hypothetical protein
MSPGLIIVRLKGSCRHAKVAAEAKQPRQSRRGRALTLHAKLPMTLHAKVAAEAEHKLKLLCLAGGEADDGSRLGRQGHHR